MIQIIIKIAALAFLGSLIGWITNRVAIKMLFKPVKPKKILFFTIQGVFPQRQQELAHSIGEIVSNEFISIPDIIDRVVSKEDIKHASFKIKENLNQVIKEKIPPVLFAMIGNKIENKVNDFVDNDGKKMMSDLLNNVKNNAKESIDIKKIVEDKINQLNFGEFEEIILKIAKTELRYIEYIGAVLGFTIGLLQGFITVVF